jgi:hypothetical protein
MNGQENINIQLAKFVDNNVPEAVLEEVKYNYAHTYSIEKFDIIRQGFKDFVKLFKGEYPGYRACYVPYHDINHSIDVFLAFSRIVDGYNIMHKALPVKKVLVGLIAALFHDSGYIQKDSDMRGTGAKYTKDHERLSIAFIRGYFKKIGLSREEFMMAGNMIKCTDLKIQIKDITFNSESEKIIGCILGSADLIAQMSSRSYLENLADLYDEFREGGIEQYKSEYDLVESTMSFYEGLAKKRLDDDFKGVYKLTQAHFRERYHIDTNIYMETIDRQLEYLAKVLKENTAKTYKEKLRRKG